MTKPTTRPKRWFKRSLRPLLALALLAAAGFYFRPVSYLDTWTYLHEDLSGIQSRNVQVAGHRVHYLVEGPANGPVVVLVHGLGASAEYWSNLAPYLAKAGFRVYIPDLLGYGRSERPADFSYSVRDEAAVVVGFMDALGLKQVELGGWSMGGWIAVLVAAQHPERVSRLMLFDAAGLNVPPTFDTALFTPSTVAQLNELEALLSPQPQPIPAFVARDILRNFRRDGWVVQRALATHVHRAGRSRQPSAATQNARTPRVGIARPRHAALRRRHDASPHPAISARRLCRLRTHGAHRVLRRRRSQGRRLRREVAARACFTLFTDFTLFTYFIVSLFPCSLSPCLLDAAPPPLRDSAHGIQRKN